MRRTSFARPFLGFALRALMSASMALRMEGFGRMGESPGRLFPASERARPTISPSKRSRQFVPRSLISDRSFDNSCTTFCLNS